MINHFEKDNTDKQKNLVQSNPLFFKFNDPDVQRNSIMKHVT